MRYANYKVLKYKSYFKIIVRDVYEFIVQHRTLKPHLLPSAWAPPSFSFLQLPQAFIPCCPSRDAPGLHSLEITNLGPLEQLPQPTA